METIMNFKLEKWKVSFAEGLAKYANNKKIADNLRNVFPHPYTLEDAKQFIKMCVESDETRQYCRAVVCDGEAVGSISVNIGDDINCKTAELGYWIGEPFWGKGIISRAVVEVCDYVFDNFDVVRIYAQPFSLNMASRRALEKAGFELESILKNNIFKNGKVLDSCMYVLFKSPPHNEQ